MNKFAYIALWVIVLLIVPCVALCMVDADDEKEKAKDMPKGVAVLMKAYPKQILKYADGCLYMRNGSKIMYDDKKTKGFVEQLDNCDPEDMFKTEYNTDSLPPKYLSDAGRSRCEALFKSMYGATAKEVESKLVAVDWFGTKIKVTSVNGVDEQLRKVASELAKHPKLSKYLACSGTFYWRKVRGANRQSAHSYGIAIDIAVTYADYWLWKNPKAKETDKIKYFNKIPLELVSIFERHGFIWGGRWYHFDTMHFEYRPELLVLE